MIINAATYLKASLNAALKALLKALGLTAAGLALISCGPQSSGGSVAKSGAVVSSGTAAIGGPFTLTAHTGAPFTEKDLLGQPSLMYFGFSYCPDVCPTALQNMGAVQDMLGADGQKLRYVFISVDTERDTPESLAPYVSSRGFPSGLIGLAGTQAQIDGAVAAYRVYAQKVRDEDSAAEFTFDHSDLIILMDKNGGFADIFSRNDSVPAIAARVKMQLNN